MRIKILVIAGFLMLSGFLSARAQQPCGCADKEDLLNLLNITQMKIQEHEFQLGLITAQEKAGGKPVMFSEDGYKKLLETILNAERAVRKEDLMSRLAKMNPGDCSITGLETGRFCLQQVNTIILRISQKVCMETLLWRNGKKESYLARMEMKQIVQGKITAYREAREFILQMLKSLPKNCRPNDWFGYVVYQRIVTTVINKAIPPINANGRPSAGISVSSGGSGNQTSKNMYIGTILVEEGKVANARGFASESYDDSKTVTGRVYCSPTKSDISQVDTQGRNDYVEGRGEGAADFRLSLRPEKGKYYIHLGFFSVLGTGQRTNFSTTSGGCKDDSINHNFPVTGKQLGGWKDYRIEEELKVPTDYLEGSKVEKPSFGNSGSQMGNISIINTEEIQVRWMLRRFSAK